MSDDPNRPWTERPAYIQRFKDKATGAEYAYIRRDGAPRHRLKAPWGTQALADEVAALIKASKHKARPDTGTFLGAIRDYRGDTHRKIAPSAEYAALELPTRIEYDRWLDRFEKEVAGLRLADIDAGFVLELRDEWAKRGYRAANLALQIFKNVCKAPRIRGDIVGNPFELIDKVPRPHKLGTANPRWLDPEVDAAIERAIKKKLPGLARAIALGRWGGFRAQTIRSVPRSARIQRPCEDGSGFERRLYWTTEKRHVLADRREDPRLTALLTRTEGMPLKGKAKVASLTLAYNGRGQSWKKRALNTAIERLVEELSKDGLVRPNLTPHGLRHARGVELALAGGSDAEIMSQLDHATPRQAAEYRKQAERLGLADAAQDRVDARIVKLSERRQRAGDGHA